MPVNHRIQTNNGILGAAATDSQNWAVIDGVAAPEPLAESYLDIQSAFMTTGSNAGVPYRSQLLRMFNMEQEYEFYSRPTVQALDGAGAIPTGALTEVYVYKLTARHDVPKCAHYGTITGLVDYGWETQLATTTSQADPEVIVNNPASTPFQNTLLCQHFKIKQVKKVTLGGRKFSFKIRDYCPAYTFDKDWRSTDDWLAFEGCHFFLIRYHGALAMGSGATNAVLPNTGWPHYQPVGGLGFMRRAKYNWVQDSRSVKMFHYEDNVVAPTASDNYLARAYQPQQTVQLSYKAQV